MSTKIYLQKTAHKAVRKMGKASKARVPYTFSIFSFFTFSDAYLAVSRPIRFVFKFHDQNPYVSRMQRFIMDAEELVFTDLVPTTSLSSTARNISADSLQQMLQKNVHLTQTMNV